MKKRRILSLVLALSLSLSSAFAFGCRGDNGWEIDSTKAQVYVGPYNGGWGSKFVDEWAKVYEEIHKNTEYDTPDGKKVGVEIKSSVSSNYGGTLAETKSSIHDIILAEVVDYRELSKNNDLVNISEWVTEINPYDGKTIKSKMTKDQVDFFTDGKGDNNYYAVPNYQASFGLYYDRTLFEEYGFFIKEVDGEPTVIGKQDYDREKDNGRLTLGPDNKTGVIDGIDYSIDDGLPRTTKEFMLLFETMKNRGVTPLSLPGGSGQYNEQFALNLWTSFAGYENMMNNFDFDGKERLVEGIAPNGDIIYDGYETTITSRNGYELQRQESKYRALDFYQQATLKTNQYVAPTVHDTPAHNLQSQNYFLTSREEEDKPCAINMDGSFWYNESSGVMTEMAKIDEGYGPNVRKIGILPLPRDERVFNPLSDRYGEKQTTFVCSYPSIFVNTHNIKEEWRLDVVKDFFQFMFSDPGLTIYSLSVNATMSYNYDLVSKDDVKYKEGPYAITLNSYAEDASYVLKDAIKVQKTYDLIVPQLTNSMYAAGACPINGMHELSWYSNAYPRNGGSLTEYKNVRRPLGLNEVTAAEYFMGLRRNIKAQKATWQSAYSAYFFN